MAGYHEGELAVQARVGVECAASRLESMLVGNFIAEPMSAFLAQRNVAFLATTDRQGRFWCSPLFAPRGFLVAQGRMLRVNALPVGDDPLREVLAGERVGLITIEFALRRRFRVNGRVSLVDDAGFSIAIEEAYGNCPQYIQQRVLEVEPDLTVARIFSRGFRTRLDGADREIITLADTFFLGTIHPERGADCSHRGGAPGFVRVEGDSLWWPDYSGNNMFNSLGNLETDPRASMVFVDFEGRTSLHLSGNAHASYGKSGPGDDDRTGRRVTFIPEAVVSVHHPEIRASGPVPYGRNPALADATAVRESPAKTGGSRVRG
ncbi:MAG: pyridoxamine 5'-phosphate oxidase family protein [Dermabacter sp.]|nr:pyridoxamine 5'-phosphate oxidase family protein [Dermabacter sp.]